MTENNNTPYEQQPQYQQPQSQAQYEVSAAEPVAVSKGTRIKAIIGMALGIYSIVISWSFGVGIPFAVAGLILSIMGAKGGEAKFSKIGKITSIIGLIASVVIGFIMIVVTIVAAMAS